MLKNVVIRVYDVEERQIIEKCLLLETLLHNNLHLNHILLFEL